VKLIQYLNEVDVTDDFVPEKEQKLLLSNLSKDVEKEFLQLVANDGFIYRGKPKSKVNVGVIKKFTSRTDRKPLSTNEEVHKFMDDFFFKKFRWKARSEGVFTTPVETQADVYGLPYLFFPIGSYKFIWSPEIYDFFTDIESYVFIKVANISLRDKRLIDRGFKKLETYTDKDLNQAIKSKGEIMFKCSSYYLVNTKYKTFLETELKKI
jgi:hypothetical protein